MGNNRTLSLARLSSLLVLVCGFVSCQTTERLVLHQVNANSEPLQIAFLPDIHFHDIYANFADGSFKGLESSTGKHNATIRTMSAQLNSTRLFNENYFALLAALDDIVKRGIKLVALPGDFSDDGQVVNMRGLRKILDRYAKYHDLEFFAAPGNHDPNRPFNRPAGKADYLGQDGYKQRIFSKNKYECTEYSQSWTKIDAGNALATICSEEVKELGYQGIMAQLASHGFYPKPQYHYWESPYSTYDTSNYDFQQAAEQAENAQRQYEICNQGKGGSDKKAYYTHCAEVMDASYLVEPVAGLWLLAIDANVYVPKADANNKEDNAKHFSGSGDAGYNKMITHKQHVLNWVAAVVKRAKAQDKQLIAFSHFPMTEFYDQQSDTIAELFGENNFQLKRRPKEAVSQLLAAMGLKVHVAGHMHINDTGMQRNTNGDFLFNIQAPSIAAYVPAYKILSLKSTDNIEVETVILEEVPDFSELFEHYQREHQRLSKQKSPQLWNKEILSANSYTEFTQWHLKELTRQRFLPQEWPAAMKQLLFRLTGQEMLVMSQLKSQITLAQLASGQTSLLQLRASAEWQVALSAAQRLSSSVNLSFADFAHWNGFELAVDFYRLRNADQLALRDISEQRLSEYTLLGDTLMAANNSQAANNSLVGVFIDQFALLFKVLKGFQTGLPNEHFLLNLSSGAITDLRH